MLCVLALFVGALREATITSILFAVVGLAVSCAFGAICIREVADQHAVEAGRSWMRAVSAITSAAKGSPDGGMSSEETRGAIQPIISTDMATAS